MIIAKNHEISGVYFQDKEIASIYLGNKLIWELLSFFIYTNDGYGVLTNDNSVIKCNNL